MKHKFLLLTMLIVFLGLSGCSSWGIALDSSFALEEYYTKRDLNGDPKEGNNTSLQVLPKIVSSKQFRPLIEKSMSPTWGVGIDYEVFYYGYDTPRLISNVVNNKKSLSDAIEYPSEEVDGKSNLNLFSISPIALGVININQNVFVAGGIGFPQYTSVSFNREKYEIKKENNDVTFFIGYSLPSPNNPFSVILKNSQKELKAQKMGSSNEEEFIYNNTSVILRYYL